MLPAGQRISWYVPRVCGTFKERTGHPSMPALLERIVKVASHPGDLVLDPVRRQRHHPGRRPPALAAATWESSCSPEYAEAVRRRMSDRDDRIQINGSRNVPGAPRPESAGGWRWSSAAVRWGGGRRRRCGRRTVECGWSVSNRGRPT
ncbi:MAG: hypothetical protein U0736_03515 [Gemmataceae bacterium]